MLQFKFPVTRVFLNILLVFTIITSALSAQTGITIILLGNIDDSGNLLTTEDGDSSDFAVVLNAKPTANVTVSITGDDSTEHSLSAYSLTFTANNWDTTQTVTVTGVDDTTLDGDITTTLTAIASNSGGYTGTETATITLKTSDNDTPDLTFTLNGDSTEYTVTDCDTTASGSLEIPSTYNGLPVTTIGDNAFRDCSGLTSVTIPDSVTSIGDATFYRCTSITSITIGGGVTSIGNATFYRCSNLTSITIPDSVISIGDNAFSLCTSLTSITIPDSVTSIGNYAIEQCTSLTSITIPDSVTSIGVGAFINCFSLTSITFEGDAPTFGTNVFLGSNSVTVYYYSYNSGWSSTFAGKPAVDINPMTFTLNSDGTEYSVTNCDTSASGSLNIPSTYSGLPVTSIDDYVFSSRIQIESVSIPSTITEIPWGAFYNCTNLNSVNIPDSIVSIGPHAFEGTAISYDYLIDGLGYLVNDSQSLGFLVDSSSASGSVTIPSTLPNGEVVKTVNGFYQNDTVTQITIPDTVQHIAGRGFAICTSLVSITLPDSLYTIGDYAFAGCTSLTEVTIPRYVSVISMSAFSGCTSLVAVNLSNVSSIQAMAFSNCASLKYILSNNDGPYLGNWSLNNTHPDLKIMLDAGNEITWNGYNAVKCSIVDSDEDGIPDEFEASPNENAINDLGFYSTSDIQDLRAGSTMIAVENGQATLSMEVEQSDDLEIWTSGGTTNLQVPVDPNSRIKFFRFKMVE